MSLCLKDFFTPRTALTTLDERLYKHKDGIIKLAEAFAKNFNQPVFIVDFYKQNMLFLSGYSQQVFGVTFEEKVLERDCPHFEYLSEEEEQMHLEITDKALELLYSFPPEERRDWSLSYNFYIRNGEKRRLLHCKVSPLYMTPEGKVWLALCSLSLSSRKEAGHPTLRHLHHLDYYKYSLKKHIWHYKEGISLTETEREILILSSQGYIMKEIADKLDKSIDSIKFYKRKLFFKMGVENITEAVFTAQNDNLLR